MRREVLVSPVPGSFFCKSPSQMASLLELRSLSLPETTVCRRCACTLLAGTLALGLRKVAESYASIALGTGLAMQLLRATRTRALYYSININPYLL